MVYYWVMKTPTIKRQKVCKTCGGHENNVHHLKNFTYGHSFVSRPETEVEAAYRQGYEEGYRVAEDRAHWGSGW